MYPSPVEPADARAAADGRTPSPHARERRRADPNLPRAALIADAGYGDWFLHRTGHGIGMTTHEPPYMQERVDIPLVEGMSSSIEPGIYVPDRFGVRIEDIVTVNADGSGRRLNNTTREVQLVA